MAQQTGTNSGIEVVCPKCGGNHWILNIEDIQDYGDVEFASICPACRAKLREQDTTGVPLQYYEADLYKFDFNIYGTDMSNFKKTIMDFFQNYYNWEQHGMGLYLSSHSPGSGKTMLACCVARSIMMRYDLQMRFTTATDYLSSISDSYKRQPEEYDKSAVYRTCDLLVLDDLGAQKSGNWQEQELFRLINGRVAAGKIMIITSNESQKDLKMDARTIDRIISCTLPLPLPEISIRRKQAEETQSKIMNEILYGNKNTKKSAV